MLKPTQPAARLDRRKPLNGSTPKVSVQIHQAAGDAVMRRHLSHWRRITARLQVLMNNGTGAGVLAGEAHALRRQCERLALQFTEIGGAAEHRQTADEQRQRGRS